MKACSTAQTPKAAITDTEWITAPSPVPYEEALSFMEQRVAAIRDNAARDLVWLLEHPSLYTAGTSAKKSDLLDPRFPVIDAGRGGQYTYHGPGQRVGYVMMDLQKRGCDLRKFVCDLEEWMIGALSTFDVKGERRQGRVGIWVDMTRYGRQGEAKIAAIGVRVRKWVTWHGVSINLAPDLSHYNGIVPCGIAGHGVTSLADIGINITMNDLDRALRQSFTNVFA